MSPATTSTTTWSELITTPSSGPVNRQTTFGLGPRPRNWKT